MTTSILACSTGAAPEEELSPRPAYVLESPIGDPPPPLSANTRPRGDEVRGYVIGDDQLAVSGATVVIDGQRIVTDDNGSFIAHAQGTYDAAILSAVGSKVSYWMGLTRKDPVLVLHGVTSGRARSSVSVSPSSAIAFDGLVAMQEPSLLGNAQYDGTTLRLEWSRTTDAHATMWAFDAQAGSRRHYTRVAKGDLALDAGRAASWPVSWQNVTERSVTPDVTLPVGWVVSRAKLEAIAGGTRHTLEEESGLDALSAFAIPQVADLSYSMTFEAMADGAKVSVTTMPFHANEDPESVSLPDPVVSVAPVDGASASKETRLTWSDGSVGTRKVEVTPVGSGPTFTIMTGGSSVALDALARISPLGTSYAWTVTSSNAFDSVDDLAAGRAPAPRTVMTSTSPMRTMTVR